jgi:hypothetical protein
MKGNETVDNRDEPKAGTTLAEEAMRPEGLNLILSYTAEDRRRGDTEAQHDHRRKGDPVESSA